MKMVPLVPNRYYILCIYIYSYMYTFLHLPKSTYFNIFQIFESLIAGAFFSLGWVLALLRKETQKQAHGG